VFNQILKHLFDIGTGRLLQQLQDQYLRHKRNNSLIGL